MSDDNLRSRLAELDKTRGAIGSKPQSIWDLVRSVHSSPVLRDWVTLESRPLSPLVVQVEEELASSSKRALVHLLLAVLTGGSGEPSVLPPWAYIRWEWPSGRLLGMFDISGEVQESDGPLPGSLVCTKSFADSVENALESGRKLPVPPESLADLYARIIDKTPAAAIRPQEIREKNTPVNAGPSMAPCGDNVSGADDKPCEEPNLFSGSWALQIEHVESYLSRSRSIVEQVGVDEITAEWRRINSRLGMSPFSVAVVGEFSRGKSTLINRLLGEDVLPDGDTPTTATLARIRYGPKNRMFFVRADSVRQELQFDESTWETFSGYENEFTVEGFLLLELANDWLKESGVDLIDTPGAGDLNEKRTALVTQTIANCDAALVAINATMALSLTERAFVEEHVLAKGTPRVAVVVTRLDQIPQAQRVSVLRYVREKLQEWAPEALVCSAHGVPILEDRSQVDAAGPEEIRDLVDKWTQDKSRMALVARQVACQLSNLLDAVLEFLATKQKSYEMSEEDRSLLITTAQESLDRQSLAWEDLRLMVDSREIDREKWVETTVASHKDKILESLTYQLNHSNNPKEWWDNDLPFLMRRELQTVTHSLEVGLNNGFQQDVQWLVKEVRRQMQWELGPDEDGHVGLVNGPENQPIGSGISSDLTRTRDYTRIGTAVLTVGAFAVVGPLALVGGAIAGVAAEKYMSGKIEDQKRELVSKLGEVIDRTLQELANEARSKLRSRYTTLLETTIKQESTWASTRLNALKEEAGDSREEGLREIGSLISETRALFDEISDWIEGGFRR